MDEKKEARLRRSRKTRNKIAELKVLRLMVHRTNHHIYAQVANANGGKILVTASSLEPEVRKKLKYGGNVKAASVVGKRIAEKPRNTASLTSLLIVPGSSITAASKPWLRPHANTA